MPNSRYFRKLSEEGMRKAKIRWDRYRAQKDAEMPDRIREMERQRVLGEGPVEEGDFLGTLSWQGRDGVKRKWIIRRGGRRDQIRIDGTRKDHGWSWFLEKLRARLS
jgi:hypothetical protein